MRTPVEEYVSDLGPEQVNGCQKAMLRVIASYYSPRYRSANLSISTLAHELLVNPRWVRRLAQQIVATGLLEYTPGRGKGNFSQFRFPQFEAENATQSGAERGPKGGQKGASSDTAIRKDLNPDQNQIPPNPPFSKGGIFPYRLTKRDHQNLARYWSKDRNQPHEGNGHTWAALLRTACGDLAICYTDAEHDLLLMDPDLWSARLELKKEPQSA